jgi:murein DD-endopeptidase MepM/ murein hydrolase activator NlpD
MQKSARKLLSIAGLLLTVLAGELLCAKAQAQGGIRLRLPFDGTFRMTSNVDHNAPGVDDGYMVVYHGEERLPCAAAYSSDSEPYCCDHHRGTDYGMTLQPVLAAASGTVSLARDQGSTIGNAVHIDHAGNYQTRYYHLDSYSVNVGDEVSVGQQIGVSGNSGAGMPWHLHFEVRHEGYVTDPFGWREDWADPIPNGPAVCLWGDGQCTAIITEDESAWYYKYPSGAGWNWYRFGNSWTLRYIPNVDTGDSTFARWRPNIPYAGPLCWLLDSSVGIRGTRQAGLRSHSGFSGGRRPPVRK